MKNAQLFLFFSALTVILPKEKGKELNFFFYVLLFLFVFELLHTNLIYTAMGETELDKLKNRIKELELQNALYQKIINNLPVGIQVFDSNGVSYLVNPKQSELLGLPDLSVGIGKFNVLTDPYAIATGAAELYQQAYNGKTYEHTYEYNLGIEENKWETRKDTRIFDEKIIPIQNNRQQTEYVLAVLDDVTDNRKSEMELKASEERFRSVFRQDKLAKLIIDPQTGQIEDCNAAASEFYGYSENELKSKNIDDINILTKPEVIEEMAKAVRLKKNFFNFKHRLASGEIRDVAVYSSPIKLKTGEKLFSIIYDITKQKEAEAALKKSEEHHKNFIDQSPDIYYKFSTKRGALYWSERVKDILGFSSEELLDNPKLWYNAIHPDDKAVVDEAIKDVGREQCSVEYRIKTKAGKWIWLHDFFMFKERIGDEIIIDGQASDITKRKELEIELAIAKNRFDMAMEATKDGVWDWNLITNEIYFSPNWKKILGYEDNELLNDFAVWEQLTHPNDVKKSWQMLNEHISGKRERFEIEFRMKHKSGKWINILSRANAYFDENGTAYRVVGTHVNIHKQKQLEEQLIAEREKARNYADEIAIINAELNETNQEYLALNEELKQINEALHETNSRLEESETKFKTVFDILDVGLTLTDEQGNIIDCNSASEKILGITKEEHLARNYTGKEWNIVRPDRSPMPASEYASVRALTENRAVLNAEMGIVKNNKITWISVNATPIKIQGYGVVVAYIDITERKNAEQERIVFNRNFEAFLNQTSDFVYFKDHNSRFVFCSQTMAEITGHHHWKQMIGKHDLEVFSPDTAQIYYEEELPVFRDGKPLLEKVNPYYDKNGNKRFVLTNKWPLFDDNQNVVGIFGVSRDITDRLKAEQKIKDSEKQLKELNATKDKFFSILAHDLRSPFNAILGFSELAVKRVKQQSFDELDTFCELIHQSAIQSFNLLNNLLQWSRIQTGKIKFRPQTLNLAKVVDETLSFLEANRAAKDITISTFNLPGIEVFADKYMLETILRNLVSNSIKFTPNQGNISLTASEKNDSIEIAVLDTGVGISKTNIEKLFKIESNVSTEGTNREKGTGLGLILCKEFVEKHGGKIRVESVLTQWTKFSFTIKKAKP